MPSAFKPAGYPAVSPYLIADDAQAILTFLAQTFDATPLRRFDDPDGGIIHAEMMVGDGVVMIGQAGESYPAVPQHIHVYVPDVDAAWQRAIAAGATAIQEPKQQEGDPDRRGGVMDSGGNSWWIATAME